jgi:hypothetical protein
MSGRAEAGDIDAFIAEFGLDGFPHTIDESGDLWAGYGVVGQPAWVFIDAEGSAEVVSGSLGEDAIVERIEALIG